MTPSLKLPASSLATDRVMMTVEAAKLIQQPIPGSPMAAALPVPRIIKSQATFPTTHQKRKTSRIKVYPAASRPIYTVSVAEQRTGVSEDKREAVSQTKRKLYQALEGINRGVFGVTSAKRNEIASLVKELESQNPTVNPTSDLEKVSGCWKLVYSTITILGSKRTKLGLRDFITLGDFLQIIDTAQSKAVNVIKFSARALNLLTGELTIEATFDIASSSRVNIRYSSSNIRPDKLMNVLSRNYHLLLSIFNPEGWLEITYLDDTMRIGRDDRDNVFILERCADEIARLRTSS